MMKLRKRIKAGICLFCLAGFFLTGCGKGINKEMADQTGKEIVGYWESLEEDYAVTFKADGTCTSSEEDFNGQYSYDESEKILSMYQTITVIKYDCKIDGDRMEISKDGDVKGTFQKTE